MSEFPTLKNHLADWANDSDDKHAIALTIETIADACIEISALVSRGPLAGELGAEQGDNTDGDAQKALDLIANDLIIEAIQAAPVSNLPQRFSLSRPAKFFLVIKKPRTEAFFAHCWFRSTELTIQRPACILARGQRRGANCCARLVQRNAYLEKTRIQFYPIQIFQGL